MRAVRSATRASSGKWETDWVGNGLVAVQEKQDWDGGAGEEAALELLPSAPRQYSTVPFLQGNSVKGAGL